MEGSRGGFSVENHPFSIAVLTSPNRRASTSSSSTAISTSITSSSSNSMKTVSAPDNTPRKLPPLLPPLLPFYSAFDGSLLVPQPSPMSGTGSTDCSPDTSFSSVTSSVFTSQDLGSPTTLQPPPLHLPVPPSPAASDDSGRGSPFVAAEVPPLRSPSVASLSGGSCGTPDPVRTSSTDAQQHTGSGSSSANTGGDKKATAEKPSHSYIALISMAILAAPERKLVLADIYQYIMDSFPYYNNQERAWRNSIRHNLSLNECFIKAGRADNGKGNYWAIHPACVEDFSKGDFRRRQARRRARSSSNLDHVAAAMALRCSSYVPMTSSPLGPYHPYLAGGIPALPGYLASATAAAYAPPTIHSTVASSPHPHAMSSLMSGAQIQPQTVTSNPGSVLPVTAASPQQAAAGFSSPAHALMVAAYGSLCGNPRAPINVTSSHQMPPTQGPPLVSPSSMAAPGGSTATAAYGQQRFSPYGRIPHQFLW